MHKIVSQDEWLAARKALLAREKEFTKARDQISAARRDLPWVKVEKPYLFDAASGKQSLADLSSEELPGLSVFSRTDQGVFHTYSSYARGLDILVGAYNFLDFAPKGRDEGRLPHTMAWVRRHDEYEDMPPRAASCHA